MLHKHICADCFFGLNFALPFITVARFLPGEWQVIRVLCMLVRQTSIPWASDKMRCFVSKQWRQGDQICTLNLSSPPMHWHPTAYHDKICSNARSYSAPHRTLSPSRPYHNLLCCFLQSLLTGLMYYRPDDPIEYLEGCLKKARELGGPDKVRWDTFVGQEKKPLPPLNGGQSRRSLFRNGEQYRSLELK